MQSAVEKVYYYISALHNRSSARNTESFDDNFCCLTPKLPKLLFDVYKAYIAAI